MDEPVAILVQIVEPYINAVISMGLRVGQFANQNFTPTTRQRGFKSQAPRQLNSMAEPFLFLYERRFAVETLQPSIVPVLPQALMAVDRAAWSLYIPINH
jgi:hypothetical protein